MVPTTTVAAVHVNDGSAQRSEVRSLTVAFSDQVSFAGGDIAAAFQLRQAASGANVGLSATKTVNDQGQTIAVLTFSGSGTDPVSAENGDAPSLADGQYTLTVLSADVSDRGGPLVGGGQGGNYVSPPDLPGGGPGELGLFRLFGDANGDGVVDQTDLRQLQSAFNVSAGNPAYLSYLDADNSGTIDQLDLGQLRSRFTESIFTVPSSPDFYVNPATGNDANSGTSPATAWKTWGRLVEAVADGTITGGAWVTSTGGAADIRTIPTNDDKAAWYTAYLAGDREVTGSHIFIDTSEAPLQATSLLVLPPGCEIESATSSLTNIQVNVPLPSTEIWAQPNAVDDPNVWGTTSATDYHFTGLYEQMDGQWAQLYPIGANAPVSTLAEALPQLQAMPGSFWVDRSTNRLYTHTIAGGDPNTDGVARQYVPEWVEQVNNDRVVEVTGGVALRIGGDGGFGFDPTTGQAQGINGIGSGEWNSISIIDSCQWSRAGKHTFSAVGNLNYGFVVFRDDVAEEGPGAVFVGYWSHFVDYTSYSGVGSNMSIYDADSTINGWANVDEPGGSDANPTYGDLISHSDDSTPSFSERLIENCNFGGSLSLGGPETAFAEMVDTVIGGLFSTTGVDSIVERCKSGYRLPLFDGLTATVTDSIFVPGDTYASGPSDLQGSVTFNRCTFDLTNADGFSSAWTAVGQFAFDVTNSVILQSPADNLGYGLICNAQSTDSVTFDHDVIQGPSGFLMLRAYNDQDEENYTFSDVMAGSVPGVAVTNTPFVANAMFNPTTYEPEPGSPAIGQAIPVANAPDYTGKIWTVRQTAGALEALGELNRAESLDVATNPGVAHQPLLAWLPDEILPEQQVEQ